MSQKRVLRLQEQFLKEVTLLIQHELKDPRIKFATVTHIDLSDNLRHAKLYVSILGSDKEIEETLEGLKRAAGYIRGQLGKRMYIRYIPELEFRRDEGPMQIDKISRILNELHDRGSP